jgi:SAM-dependent methyltransferase
VHRTSDSTTADFYDDLAPFYHLIYEDWEQAITQQGADLARLLQRQGVNPQQEVLDATCGIGTQTIGLLQHGYRVTASDLSPGAIERLRAELARRALQAITRTDDLRLLQQVAPESFPAIISCDNSIPHLLDDRQILQALRSCLRSLRPGGTAIFSVRDYANIPRRNPDLRLHSLRRDGESRALAYQLWEWEGDQYELRMYLTRDDGAGGCETRSFRSRYYAVTIARLLELMAEAGYAGSCRIDDGFFQPLLAAAGLREHLIALAKGHTL